MYDKNQIPDKASESARLSLIITSDMTIDEIQGKLKSMMISIAAINKAWSRHIGIDNSAEDGHE